MQLMRSRPVHRALRRGAVCTDGESWVALERSGKRCVQRDALSRQQIVVQGLAQELVSERITLARRIPDQHVVLDRFMDGVQQLVLGQA